MPVGLDNNSSDYYISAFLPGVYFRGRRSVRFPRRLPVNTGVTVTSGDSRTCLWGGDGDETGDCDC